MNSSLKTSPCHLSVLLPNLETCLVMLYIIDRMSANDQFFKATATLSHAVSSLTCILWSLLAGVMD